MPTNVAPPAVPAPSALVLRGVTLEDGSVVDVRVHNGVVTDVGAPGTVPGRAGDEDLPLPGYVLMPAPCEPHAHLDKAFLADRVPNPRGDLITAITAMDAYREHMTPEEVAGRAERAARVLLANGVTAVRTHVDCTLGNGTRSVEGLVRVRERLAGSMHLQIVALVGIGFSLPVEGAGLRSLLRDALDAGADVVGGCPHLEDDPERGLDVLLTAAAERGVPVDLHTDETLDPTKLNLRSFAREVARSGFGHGATASHCVSLGQQPEAVQREVAERCAAAGISVITLPQTNLFLQGRDAPSCTPRGLTALRALLDAGVNVAGGADNLQDPFNTMGRGDPFETAALLVMAGHLTPQEALHAVGAAARRALGLPAAATVHPGAPADLLAVRAASAREAVAFGPPDRVVIHQGRVVAAKHTVHAGVTGMAGSLS